MAQLPRLEKLFPPILETHKKPPLAAIQSLYRIHMRNGDGYYLAYKYSRYRVQSLFPALIVEPHEVTRC